MSHRAAKLRKLLWNAYHGTYELEIEQHLVASEKEEQSVQRHHSRRFKACCAIPSGALSCRLVWSCAHTLICRYSLNLRPVGKSAYF